MRLAVLTSCTGRKATSHPRQLRADDFSDPARLAQRERELGDVLRPAGKMYTGDQHLLATRGVEILRRALVDDAVSFFVVSAGYGLLDEFRLIAPYDVTFATMGRREARSWSYQLGIAAAVRDVVAAADLAFVLLGSRYLDAVEPPIVVSDTKIIYFASSAEATRVGAPSVVVVPAGKSETGRFGAGYVALKGMMLNLLASGIEAQGPGALSALMADDTARTATGLIEAGLRT